MLEAMRRETSSQHIRDLIKRIRAGVPGIALRTTFIAGFPGETKEDFETLLEFIEETRFERLGVFKYSPRGRHARGQARGASHRAHQGSALEKGDGAATPHRPGANRPRRSGSKIRVLVEAPGVARSEADAPEVDARVFVPKSLPVGRIRRGHRRRGQRVRSRCGIVFQGVMGPKRPIKSRRGGETDPHDYYLRGGEAT